jgi:hypothetical protein
MSLLVWLDQSGRWLRFSLDLSCSHWQVISSIRRLPGSIHGLSDPRLLRDFPLLMQVSGGWVVGVR